MRSLRAAMGDRVVIATHNPGKAREIAALLAPFGLEVVTADALGLPEPDETEDSFAGNAVLKANAAAEASGLTALSDDSGFMVAALGGAPGVYSARWAGPGKDFAVAMRRVWDEVQASGSADRNAAFVCALALTIPGEPALVYEGRVDGELVWPPRGENGFGYDPMFAPAGEHRTFGEMAPSEKLAMNHRARAFAKLVEALE